MDSAGNVPPRLAEWHTGQRAYSQALQLSYSAMAGCTVEH
jgi:hypothetical protein